MQKNIRFIAMLLVVCGLLIACSDDDNVEKEPTNEPEESKETDDEQKTDEEDDEESKKEDEDKQDDSSSNNDSSEADEDNASAEEDDAAEGYESYTNGRFGFSVEYPDTFEADYMPANNDGMEVHDDTAVIIASGSHAGIALEEDENFIKDADSMDTFYERAVQDAEEDGNEISYKTLHDDWYVVSYVDGDNHVYKKSIMADDYMANLVIEYPAGLQEEYSPVVDHVSESFMIP